MFRQVSPNQNPESFADISQTFLWDMGQDQAPFTNDDGNWWVAHEATVGTNWSDGGLFIRNNNLFVIETGQWGSVIKYCAISLGECTIGGEYHLAYSTANAIHEIDSFNGRLVFLERSSEVPAIDNIISVDLSTGLVTQLTNYSTIFSASNPTTTGKIVLWNEHETNPITGQEINRIQQYNFLTQEYRTFFDSNSAGYTTIIKKARPFDSSQFIVLGYGNGKRIYSAIENINTGVISKWQRIADLNSVFSPKMTLNDRYPRAVYTASGDQNIISGSEGLQFGIEYGVGNIRSKKNYTAFPGSPIASNPLTLNSYPSAEGDNIAIVQEYFPNGLTHSYQRVAISHCGRV